MKSQIITSVEEIRGNCPIYKTRDKITIDEFYIKSNNSQNISIHAFVAMTTMLSAFIRGSSASELGIDSEKNVGYLQCPDPGPPCSKGGTVLFKLKREPTT